MKKENFIQFGHFSISFPNETSAVFTIFEDLADFFQMEVQSEAVSVLENKLKDISLKPKPTIDHESGFTSIISKSADTIFETAKIIYDSTLSEKKPKISEKELVDIYFRLKSWKKPSKQKWKIGDILSVPLLDNTFAFGQIVGTHLTKKAPILALFNLKKANTNISENELRSMLPIAVFNSNEEEIANYTFKVLCNYEILVSPEKVNNKKLSGGATLDSLGNAYFGLTPWNVLHSDTYYDEYLLPEIERPKNIIWLNTEERNLYRRKYFNIDENNNYIK